MEILEESRVMCDFEALQVVLSHQSSTLKRFKDSSVPMREIKNNGLLNYVWLLQRIIEALSDNPAAYQDKSNVSQFLSEMSTFDLSNSEILQIVNLRPDNKELLQAILNGDDVHRISQSDTDRLLNLVQDHL